MMRPPGIQREYSSTTTPTTPYANKNPMDSARIQRTPRPLGVQREYSGTTNPTTPYASLANANKNPMDSITESPRPRPPGLVREYSSRYPLTNPNSKDDATAERSEERPEMPRTDTDASTGSASVNDADEWELFPQLDKLTSFDFLDQLALPQRIEKLNQQVRAQRATLKKQRDRLQKRYNAEKDRVFKSADIDKYVKKYTQSLDRALEKFDSNAIVPLQEKIAFCVGVANLFITGYLVGGHPEWVHIWYSLQLLYFLPVRYYTYHQKGYHYFLADLCYFVNLLLILSIWVFPNSRRLMISAYCLSYGNNAWAIAMWRNSMVFHSLDKVTSVFIHIMPPVVLHCLVHLIDPQLRDERFPAISRIKHVELYQLNDMILWATVPYAIWQLTYHYFITIRKQNEIAAGRPTSFTWLRKSYANTWLGKIVLSLPESLQSPAFMLIQYAYALVTMLPCSKFFYSRLFSGVFISAVGLISVYNGANYYIDVFGKRFQKEVEQLKKEMALFQSNPGAVSPPATSPAEPEKEAPSYTEVQKQQDEENERKQDEEDEKKRQEQQSRDRKLSTGSILWDGPPKSFDIPAPEGKQLRDRKFSTGSMLWDGPPPGYEDSDSGSPSPREIVPDKRDRKFSTGSMLWDGPPIEVMKHRDSVNSARDPRKDSGVAIGHRGSIGSISRSRRSSGAGAADKRKSIRDWLLDAHKEHVSMIGEAPEDESDNGHPGGSAIADDDEQNVKFVDPFADERDEEQKENLQVPGGNDEELRKRSMGSTLVDLPKQGEGVVASEDAKERQGSKSLGSFVGNGPQDKADRSESNGSFVAV